MSPHELFWISKVSVSSQDAQANGDAQPMTQSSALRCCPQVRKAARISKILPHQRTFGTHSHAAAAAFAIFNSPRGMRPLSPAVYLVPERAQQPICVLDVLGLVVALTGSGVNLPD